MNGWSFTVKLGKYTSPNGSYGYGKVRNEIRVKNVFLRSEAPKKKSYVRHIMAHRLVFNIFFLVPQQKQARKFGGMLPSLKLTAISLLIIGL